MSGVRCAICGELHGLAEMQIGYQWPDAYLAVPHDDRERRSRCTGDLCDIDGKMYFLRAALEIPVRGEPEPFAWGVWVRVAEDDFRRYVSLFRNDAQGRDPPFAGWLANQLPGYPQTLDIAVMVDLTNARRRPALSVASHTHPLGAEQRDGIFLERALELMSPFLHDGVTFPVDIPHVATIARDGWALDSAIERFMRRDGVNWLPSTERRDTVQLGEHAKLLVRIEASDETGRPAQHVERMWVQVDYRQAAPSTCYSGCLTNHPRVAGLTRHGMRIWFGPEHIIDIEYADHTTASDGTDVLQCASHGPSQTTYVCQHLPQGEGLGFHQAEDPGNPRPDAWCDACDAVLEEHGEWADEAAAFAKITLLCAACYDIAEARNRQSL